MRGLKRYYGTKLLWYLVTFFVALALNFFLPRAMPGDPVAALVGQVLGDAGAAGDLAFMEVERQFIERFGLDRPLPMQFLYFVRNVFRFDFGTSFLQHPRAVTDIIAESILWTVALQIPAILTGWILGNLLGAIAAYLRKGFDKGMMPIFIFISNVPAFGMAIIMLWVFGITLGWAPIGGGFAFDMVPHFSLEFIQSVIRHYQLPFWTMVIITIGGQAIGMRSMSIYELNADYVKYARFLGIKDRKIIRYVFRNAMLPQITGLAFALGAIVAGNIVAETIFGYPGIGLTLLSSIRGGDYPMISALTLVLTVGILIANLVIEIIYSFLDPRIKAAQQDN